MNQTLGTFAASILTLLMLCVFAGTAMAQDQPAEVKCDPFINGIASGVIPGWGQWLNGEGSKAVFHIAVAVGLGGAA